MTFWQGVVISFLANSTNMAGAKTDEDSDPDLWGKQAQNFLICLEMLGFSIAHFYCFPTEEWEEGYRPKAEKIVSAGDNLALGDFMNDLKLILGGSNHSDRKKKKKAKKGEIGTIDSGSPATDLSEIDNSLDVSLDMDKVKQKLRMTIEDAVGSSNDNIRDAAIRMSQRISPDEGDVEDGILSTINEEEQHDLSVNDSALLLSNDRILPNDLCEEEEENSRVRTIEGDQLNLTADESTSLLSSTNVYYGEEKGKDEEENTLFNDN